MSGCHGGSHYRARHSGENTDWLVLVLLVLSVVTEK